MTLIIDVTVSNDITPDSFEKLRRGKPATGSKAQGRELRKWLKYQELCPAAGMSFFAVVFESQGLVGQRSLEHFDKRIVRQADEIRTPVTPLKSYWSRRLSVILQQSVALAISIKMATLYTGPTSPTADDESAWPEIVGDKCRPPWVAPVTSCKELDEELEGVVGST